VGDRPPLEIRDLVKSFGDRRALDGATLELAEGELLGLLGPNGAGKSTLVRSVVGRVRPEAGEIRISGLGPQDPGSRRLVGYVPQEIALYPLLSPAENLWAFGRYQGLEGEELTAAIRRGLEWTGLVDRSRERTERLSGGMKRRLNIAAGTIHRPRLLLLDEPTVGVDPQSRERIYGMIGELRREGVSLLYTTHYMEEAERLCERVAIVDHGKIIAEGTPQELIGRLQAPHILEFSSEPAVGASLLQTIPGVREVRQRAARWFVSVESLVDAVPALFSALQRSGAKLVALSTHRATLEDVFITLTGRELRDE